MRTTCLLALLAAAPVAAQRVYPSPQMEREVQKTQDRRPATVVAPMRVDGRTGDVRLPQRVWVLAPGAFGDMWVPVDLRSGDVNLNDMVIWPSSLGAGPQQQRRDKDAPVQEVEPPPAKKKAAEEPQTGWRKYIKKQ
jgi:hypothetical protein